jgi:predicted CXXCH cytochrome family protein
VVDARAGAAHERVACEACHGALYAHAQDPGAVTPERPDGATVCLRCHEAMASRPDWFPQVDFDDHAMGDPCNACHEPHHPSIE